MSQAADTPPVGRALVVLPGHSLGKGGHDPVTIYLTFLPCYILSQVSVRPSVSLATISVGSG